MLCIIPTSPEYSNDYCNISLVFFFNVNFTETKTEPNKPTKANVRG